MTENPMQDRCDAHCRTTGKPCKNFPMPNGRCRMHGGKSTGRSATHGFYRREAIEERQQLRGLIRDVKQLVKNIGMS